MPNEVKVLANKIKITKGERAFVIDYAGKTWTETKLSTAIESAVTAGAKFADFELAFDVAAAHELQSLLVNNP